MSCFPRCIQKPSENATADAVYPFVITLFFVIAFTVIRCVIIYLSNTRLEHAIAEANANVTSSRDPTLRFVAGDKLDGGYRIRIVKDSSAICPRFIDVLSRSQMNLE